MWQQYSIYINHNARTMGIINEYNCEWNRLSRNNKTLSTAREKKNESK